MLTIYGSPRTSAGRCFWVLEELGVPYETAPLDMMKAREHRQPNYLALNPNGKVPVLKDDDFTLWESLAINFYLAEKYGPEWRGGNLAERAKILQWSTWSQVDLQPPMIDIVIQTVFTPEAERDANLVTRAQQVIPPKLEILDHVLAGRHYLVGDRCTLADVHVASVVHIAPMIKISLEPYAEIGAWLERLRARPAFAKWMALRKS